MYTRRLLLLGSMLVAALACAQDANVAVQVFGAVKQPLTLAADELAKLPRSYVTTISDGIETTCEGVRVHEVLKRAGVPQGPELRGKALAGYVLAQAQDGYQVVFSLAELGAADLARRVNVSRQTIYAIEAGTYVPNTKVALHLSQELEVTVDELFSLCASQHQTPESVSADVLTDSRKDLTSARGESAQKN
jgi:DNA-binding XRE family transcriptional regulator